MIPVAGAGRYVAWQALVGTWFWIPVFFLYFTGQLGLDGALLLEAAYYLAVVVAEVPSGYVSDRVGRKPTLVLSSVAFLVAYAAFLWGGSLGVLLVGQVSLALGISFRSGTDTSYHLELLTAAGVPDQYGEREARLVRLTLVGGAAAALLGGGVGVFGLRWPYALCLAASIAALALALSLRPVPRDPGVSGPWGQVSAVWVAVRGRPPQGVPSLGWLFGVAVLSVVLAHVPYELYQPYLKLVELGDADLPTPLVSGVHAALAMLLAAPVAGWSVRWATRFGTRATLLVALAAQVVVIAAIAVAVHPVIAVLLVLRGVPGALLRAPLDTAVAPQLAPGLRATYLSVQSLGGRLAYAAVLAGMSLVAADGVTADSVRLLAGLIAVGGGVAWVVLASIGRRGQHRTDPPVETLP